LKCKRSGKEEISGTKEKNGGNQHGFNIVKTRRCCTIKTIIIYEKLLSLCGRSKVYFNVWREYVDG